MADNSMSNIGVGISLQGKTPQNYMSIIGRRMAEDAANRAARAKKAEKDDEDKRKFINDIKVDPTKVHRLDWDEARQIGNDYITQVQKLQKEYPENWDNYTFDLQQQTRDKIGQLYGRKQKLDQDEVTLKTDIDRGTATLEQMKVYDVYKKGKQSDLLTINDNYGSTGSAPDLNGRVETVINPVPKFDWTQIAEKEFNKPSYQMAMATLQQKAGDPKVDQDFRTYLKTYGMPRTKAEADIAARKIGYNAPLPSSESLIEAYASDPMHKRSLEQYARSGIENDPQAAKEYIDPSTPEKRKTEILTQKALEKAAPFLGVSLKEKTFNVKPPAASRDSGASGDDLLRNGLVAKDRTVNYGGSGQTTITEKIPYSQSIATKGSTMISPSSSLYDDDNHKWIDEKSLGSAQLQFKAGEFITKYVQDENGKTGYRPYIRGQAIDINAIDRIADGIALKKELDNLTVNGEDSNENIEKAVAQFKASHNIPANIKLTRNVSVPLEQVAGFLQSKPNNNPVQGWYQLTDKANKAESGQDKQSKQSKTTSVSGGSVKPIAAPKQEAAKTGGYSNPTMLKDASGKTIKAGVKNGKWYNTETGAEIK